MSATACRACGGYVGRAVPHVCDLDALAGPIRRRAFDAAAAMPPHLQRAVGTLLVYFTGPVPGLVVGSFGFSERAPTVRGIYGARSSTVTSQFARAGYASPKAILDALRLALALRLLDAGETVEATAHRLGCSSPQSFGRAFRRLTGRTIGQRGALAWEAIVDAALSPQRALALDAEAVA